MVEELDWYWCRVVMVMLKKSPFCTPHKPVLFFCLHDVLESCTNDSGSLLKKSTLTLTLRQNARDRNNNFGHVFHIFD